VRASRFNPHNVQTKVLILDAFDFAFDVDHPQRREGHCARPLAAILVRREIDLRKPTVEPACTACFPVQNRAAGGRQEVDMQNRPGRAVMFSTSARGSAVSM
jgi:hypothetical protein